MESEESRGGDSRNRISRASSKASCSGNGVELEDIKGWGHSGNRRSRSSSKCSCVSGSGDEDPWGWFEAEEMVSDYGAAISGLVFSEPHVCAPVQLPEQLMRQSVSIQAMWQVGIDYLHASLPNSPPGQYPETVRQKQSHLCEVCVDEPELILESENKFGGQSVSKSYVCRRCKQVSMIVLRIPRFQVVRYPDRNQYAEYLVTIQIGALVLAAWRRYTAFEALFHTLVSDPHKRHNYRNTMFSWEMLRRTKRWYRCLEEDYLALKCFLLERFLHDLVYECDEATALCSFMGA